MDILEFLEKSINRNMDLSEMVNVFEKMCKMKIEGSDEEEELLLFEVGTYSFTGEKLFYFSLVRQYRTDEEDDEYLQLHLDIMYKPDKNNKLFSGNIWSDETDMDFFDYIRQSEEYCYLKENHIPIEKIQIYRDGT